MKRYLIIRYGAYGDCLILTPVIKKLKELGHYIILNTSERGVEVFKNSPYVDEFIEHKLHSVPIDKLEKHWEKVEKDCKADEVINFTGSFENNIALHPNDPEYNLPKWMRAEICDKNIYDLSQEWAGLEGCDKIPNLHFDEDEVYATKQLLKKNKVNILWCMAGSGKNKLYPWQDFVMAEIFKDYKNVHILTVGDEAASFLEEEDKNITNLCGKIPMRVSMCLTKYVDLVIAPDTGVLHAAGCFDTPKIGIFGATSINQTTKYFENDFSVQADCACSPCHRLIYSTSWDAQCPVDVVTGCIWCLSIGLPPEKLYEQIRRVLSRP